MSALYNGVPPKPDDERTRRNAPRYKKVPVKWDGIIRMPELPREGILWCPKTRQWWKVWQESPQSMVMTETDYQVMFEAALLHNRLWTNPSKLSANEMTNLIKQLNSILASYGATHADRMKLRIDITTPNDGIIEAAEIQAAAEDAVDYATRLNKKAAEI